MKKNTIKKISMLSMFFMLSAAAAITVPAKVYAEDELEPEYKEIKYNEDRKCLLGDIVEDDKVDLEDAKEALKYALGFGDETKARLMFKADINGDGRINVKDARDVLKQSIGATDNVCVKALPEEEAKLYAFYRDYSTNNHFFNTHSRGAIYKTQASFENHLSNTYKCDRYTPGKQYYLLADMYDNTRSYMSFLEFPVNMRSEQKEIEISIFVNGKVYWDISGEAIEGDNSTYTHMVRVYSEMSNTRNVIDKSEVSRVNIMTDFNGKNKCVSYPLIWWGAL